MNEAFDTISGRKHDAEGDKETDDIDDKTYVSQIYHFRDPWLAAAPPIYLRVTLPGIDVRHTKIDLLITHT